MAAKIQSWMSNEQAGEGAIAADTIDTELASEYIVLQLVIQVSKTDREKTQCGAECSLKLANHFFWRS